MILERLSFDPMLEVKYAARQFEAISEDALRNLVREKIKDNMAKLKDANTACKFLMGVVMAEVRGRIEGGVVNRIVKEEVENSFKA